MAALRAGTAMGSAASTAYQMGQSASGTTGIGGVAAGLGGVANAAGGAAKQSARSFAASVAAPFAESAERGRQAAWTGVNGGTPVQTSPTSSSAASATDGPSASDTAPTWARRLRTDQAARHHRHAAIQTIKDGDRPGGAANPDLSKED